MRVPVNRTRMIRRAASLFPIALVALALTSLPSYAWDPRNTPEQIKACEDIYAKCLRDAGCTGKSGDDLKSCEKSCTIDHPALCLQYNASGGDVARAKNAVIRTGAGLCLDAHAPAMATNGGRVQAWACNGQRQQRWSYESTRRALRVASGLCLDVHAPEMTTNGGRVQVWVCNGAPQQQWTPFADGSLRNGGGLCLDVHAPDQANNGARVQVWQCNGSQQQRFTTAPPSSSITPDTSVRPPAIR